MKRSVSHIFYKTYRSLACGCVLSLLIVSQCCAEDPQAEHAPKFERDPRLPPLLPGEEVNVNGQKMKVWTSAGSVPGGPSAEVPSKSNTGVNVIVDGRDRDKHHNSHDHKHPDQHDRADDHHIHEKVSPDHE